MTEEQATYDTNRPQLQTSIDGCEHPRQDSKNRDVWALKELKAANHRLNERVRELDYALMQCEEDKALAETQCDEARQWARALLARAENLGWLVERIGASWREGKVQLEEALAEAKLV